MEVGRNNKTTHGAESFDRKYYKRFFTKYTNKEFNKYYNWAWGWFRFIKKHIPLKNYRGKSVLEIGCSIGAFSKVLQREGLKIVATDVSPYIVTKAKNMNPDVDFEVVNVEKDIKIDKKFDYVISLETVEHLKNPQDAFKNIYKVLEKNGLFIFSTPFPSKQSLADPTHINVHSPDWWLKLGKKTDFRSKKYVYATFIPFLYRICRCLSIGFPWKLDLPYINSTCIFIFRK